MGPKTLPTIWGAYMKLVTKYQISAINSCWEKCAYMFNVYGNQLSRQTGSRNVTGPKTLPTIWHTYMKLVTKYQILCLSVRPSKIFFVAFFSVTVDGRNLIFGHKHHIGIPYCGKRFWTHQIPTSCLPTLELRVHFTEMRINTSKVCLVKSSFGGLWNPIDRAI
jgi:hypothetical protein